jgi:hypothetical protein
MRTWTVHMRSPRALLTELGPAGFACFQLVVGGSVLAALVHPIVVASFLYGLAAGLPFLGTDGKLITTLAWLYGTTLGTGYLVSIVLGLRGLARRRLMFAAWALLLMPVHWMLLSLAAWRALYQLARAPHRWEKTEHGRAATSRRARSSSRAVLRALLAPEEHEPQREAAE